MTVSPTKREPPFGAGTPGGGFLFLRMVNLTFGIPDLSIPDSPQKSSAVQKVYKHSSLGIYCIFLSMFMIYWFCGSSPPILLKEPGLRLPASASALGAGLASCWPRPQQLLPVSATGGGRRRCTSSASGLTDSTRTVSPTKWKAPWERQLLGGFSFLVKPMESSHNPIFSICDSPQKSSAVQKVYRAALSVSG